ncbi:hypothetical protein GCM10010124_11880 [Pilimelia terevasa]|uniref:Putative zinc-finger domain-containing protein n=1 Tax=Pilimelia terevasa TaxID=53372 RepID=A0A8J3BH60_9ACTN|nr:zf-HC2 domain-containing protein [Pilimelia terevasa]GGK20999.1 hypothetical protein GCM10010124_11880 [Pilimelia terevasa]
MSCPHAHSDASYVLGALGPAERTEYEQHLETCPDCREAVAEIAVLPGLLARLDPGTAEDLLAREPGLLPGPRDGGGRATALPPAPSALRSSPRPLAALRPAPHATARTGGPRRPGRLRRHRRAFVGGGLAAAALAAVVGVAALLPGGAGKGPSDADAARTTVPTTRSGAASAPRLVAMVPVSRDIPLTAELGLTRQGYGTAVRMLCRYADTGPDAPTWTVSLLAYGPDDSREQVGSWVAEPGGPVVAFDGVTRFSGDQLTRLEVVRADNGQRLVTYEVPR